MENKSLGMVNSLFSDKEQEILIDIKEKGAKAIAPTLAAQMFSLFLEGYSCAEIAKQNKMFSEGDILYACEKFQWHEQRDIYAANLQRQISEKLAKSKLESVEFLTNMLSVTHKQYRDQTLKYLQTGKEEDMPESWAKGPKSYMDLISTIAKVTGEDKVSKVNIDQKTETNLNINGNSDILQKILEPDNAAKILSHLVKESESK
ncbi:MAG TPA: hypothetical protein PKI14_05005 [Fervidobacterium sp.]|nr:hypothetical protein [Fervidobacterium sp.]